MKTITCDVCGRNIPYTQKLNETWEKLEITLKWGSTNNLEYDICFMCIQQYHIGPERIDYLLRIIKNHCLNILKTGNLQIE